MDHVVRRPVGLTLAAVMAATVVCGIPERAAAAPADDLSLARERSAAVRPVSVPEAKPGLDEELALRGTPAVSWPTPGKAEVSLATAGAAVSADAAGNARVRAGKLPVSVGAGKTTAARSATPGRVRVEMLPRRADGLLLRVNRADGVAIAGQVNLEVDYSTFRDAYGGDWATRLRLMALPECALSTPDLQECAGTPIATRNDGSGRLSGDIEVQAKSGSGLFAVMAAASSGAGDFKATGLSPSSTWSVGTSSGDFNWRYPMETVPGLGGPQPTMDLGYSSGGVDGRTSSTNNQPSWVGEGFAFDPGGYIERRYKSCGEDTTGGNNSGRKTGDLCWATDGGRARSFDNAVMALNGRGGELIRDDATGQWKSRVDDGTKVELLTDGDNGDDNGEYWRITTPDGTQYYFGKHKPTGWALNNEVTNSVWTVPVFGNHSGEPCYKSTFDTSYCQQAWRWNLDYVVDRNGNTMSLFYGTEKNNYARNITATKVSTYTRGGWLKRIDYGQRDGEVYSKQAVGRVLFTEADRCIPGTTCTASSPANWPDVPWDQGCTSTTSCTNKYNPTFWTQKRLAAVTTQVWGGTSYRNVDSWTLTHSYPSPGDGTRAGMWLASIQHKGLVGGEASLPPITFDPIQLPNRVDGVDGIPPMNWLRVNRIQLDSGGEITIAYSPKECAVPGNLPAPDSNTKRCHPTRWTPDGQSTDRLDWFNKYVVTEVTEVDRTTGLPPVVTRIEYPSTPAWRFDEADGMVPDNKKSWSQWRGYDRVRVHKGPVGGPRSLTESLYFRGMDGDRTASGGKKEVWITDSAGTRLRDSDQFANVARENIKYTTGGAVHEKEITDPWLSGATATRTRSWGTTQAFRVEEGKVRQSEANGSGGWQNTGAENVYDAEGTVLRSNDLNDVSNPDDDTCTRYSYTRNESVWIINLPYRIETVAVNCDRAPAYPDDLISDVRHYYDGSTTLGAPPVRGEITRTEELTGWRNGAPTYVTTRRASYDVYGREIEAYDVRGARTTTAYTPATGGPVTQIDVTNALGHRARTMYDPAWGEETAVLDANDRRTELRYDPLGRLVKVWLPGRATTQTPSAEYSYLVRTTGANAVASRTLQPNGDYETEYELYDGLMRPRQTQEPAPGGGRILSDKFYDSRGLVTKENGPYYNDAPPGSDVVIADENTMPAQLRTVFDENERPTNIMFMVDGLEKWRTTHTYGVNRHDVDPPDGEAPTTRITDVEGNLIELRQYHGASPSGTYDATKYTYTNRGQLATVTDPAGNVWRYSYDLRGLRIRTEEPDRGATDYTYNDAGDVVATRDARGITLAHAYDILGRQTASFEGSLSGTKLTSRTYDALPDGTPARGSQIAATRYVGTSAYVSEVTGFDDAGRPTGTRITIPASERALAGKYEFSQTYKVDGSLDTIGLPAGGGLPAEQLRSGYDVLGQAVTLSGASSYVTATDYTQFGELRQMTLSAGGSTTRLGYEYEYGTHRLTRAVVSRDTAPQRVADLVYAYDPAGNITSIADQAEDAEETQCFRYDYLRRLSEAWTPTSGDCQAAPAAGALGGPAPYWHSWTFDKAGNRLSETRTVLGGARTTTAYNYPAAGQARPHAVNRVTTTGPDGAAQVEEFGYDAAGNMASRRKGTGEQSLSWDAEGHVSSITKAGVTTSFLYDAGGNRLIRRDANGTTLYLGDTELRLAPNGTVTGTRYYSFAGRTIAVRTSADNALNWLALDHHGTPEISIDASSQNVKRRRHTPYGELRGAAVALPGEKAFVGGTADPGTGLVHLGAREYDPALGRFISVDPVIDHGEPQQVNGYTYANNNPVTYADPDGDRWVISTRHVKKMKVRTVTEKKPYWQRFWVAVTTWEPVRWVTKIPLIGSLVKWGWKQVTKMVEQVRQLWRTIRKTITEWVTQVQRIKTWVKDEVKKAWKKVTPHINRIKKRAGNIARGAGRLVKSTGRGLAAAGKWAGNQMKPGANGWKILKMGLAIGAFLPFCSAICAIGAAAMTAYDMGDAARQGKWKTAGWEAAGLATFGLGRVAQAGMNSARVAQSAARAMPSGAAGRVDMLTRANATIANGERTEASLGGTDAALFLKDAVSFGIEKGFGDAGQKFVSMDPDKE
ncbi:RHS repeat-associated core domain-containing protein [Plantactinospora sp. ZYX-F-223]|uniref:RHS repeat-associated core domain-containing protein n=1 Tax=Plantactinospora sp. ZYX-F-223 TaxID=3144103 RepID=UPI0031FDCB5D